MQEDVGWWNQAVSIVVGSAITKEHALWILLMDQDHKKVDPHNNILPKHECML